MKTSTGPFSLTLAIIGAIFLVAAILIMLNSAKSDATHAAQKKCEESGGEPWHFGSHNGMWCVEKGKQNRLFKLQ